MFSYLVCSFKSSHSKVVILVFRNTFGSRVMERGRHELGKNKPVCGEAGSLLGTEINGPVLMLIMTE